MRGILITACLFFSAFSAIPSSNNPLEKRTQIIVENNNVQENMSQFIENKEENLKDNIDDTTSKSIEIEEEPVIEIIVNFTDVDEEVFATCSVNIRKQPNAKADKVGVLSLGDSIKRVGVGDNGWSKVIYKDNECFINSKYISTEKPVIPQEEIVTQSQFNPDNYFIKKEGNVSDGYIIKVESYWNKIPENVRLYLINQGITIYVTDTNLAKRFYHNQPKNTPTSKRSVGRG